MNIDVNVRKWADEMWGKLDNKLSRSAQTVGDMIPYTTKDGKYCPHQREGITCWTNGFWGGLMWLMYAGTKNDVYRKAAEKNEELLEEAFEIYDGLHHDVGFMWLLTSGANNLLTGNEKAVTRLRRAADYLAARFNVDGGYIRAWNGPKEEVRRRQIAIIDCMMNIPLLYRATEDSMDDRYKAIAMRHADKTMNFHVRPDGSVNHIMRYDNHTGEVVCIEGGQGYDENSSWTRGQSWGLYGFTLSYIHTGKKEYLDTAKKIAHYFIAACCNDWLVRSDFRAPEEPILYDNTAACIAACGLIEISKLVPEHESAMYFNAAINILKATEEKFADWSQDTDGILTCGSEWYHNGKHMHIIYGDYYFAEAIYKLRNVGPLFW